jgi:hypothetical protein
LKWSKLSRNRLVGFRRGIFISSIWTRWQRSELICRLSQVTIVGWVVILDF